MAFELISRFEIGNYKFRGCNDLKITKSIHEIADRGLIKVPTSFALKLQNVTTVSAPTAQIFMRGDKVRISLGYNGTLREEFVGFISNINFKTPVELELEGYSWQLRYKKIKKSWSSTTLKEVLTEVIKDTDCTLHPDIPDMPLKNIVINDATGLAVIDYIKDLLKGALVAFFIGNTLYMGLAYYDVSKTTVKHRMGWNVIDGNDLKVKKADDTKVNIEIKFRKDSGVMKTVTAGEKGGATRSVVINSVTDEKHLNDIAKAKLLQECYNGYEGTFTTFLVPYCQPGYRSELTDNKYPERGGNYFVESTEVNYGMAGARRTVGIGLKLSSI